MGDPPSCLQSLLTCWGAEQLPAGGFIHKYLKAGSGELPQESPVGFPSVPICASTWGVFLKHRVYDFIPQKFLPCKHALGIPALPNMGGTSANRVRGVPLLADVPQVSTSVEQALSAVQQHPSPSERHSVVFIPFIP